MSKISSEDEASAPGGRALVPYRPRQSAVSVVQTIRRVRVPPTHHGIQVNGCKTVGCANFGIEPMAAVTIGAVRRGATRIADGYRIAGQGRQGGSSRLLCTLCNQHSSLKGNIGVYEELRRISAYLTPPAEPSCPTKECESHGHGVHSDAALYVRHGSVSGRQRWRCRLCGATTSAPAPSRKQAKSHKNRLIFSLLMNKCSMRAIARVAGINERTVYNKIDFLYGKCVAFAAERERLLAEMDTPRLWISTDRQDYAVNWSDRKDKRITQLTAVASADNRTGYIFATNLAFDPDADRNRVEAEAIVAGDFDGRDPAFRRFCHFWLEPDFEEAREHDRVTPTPAPSFGMGVWREVADAYADMERAIDPEAGDQVKDIEAMPNRGIRVKFEYTVHAHYRLLRQLLPKNAKIRFFMDQDDTLRAGCLNAFRWQILEGNADAFFVQIDKTLTVDERRNRSRRTREMFNWIRNVLGHPEWSDRRILITLLGEALQRPRPQGQHHWRDRWIRFPLNTMPEPDKAICHISDRGDYGIGHLARIMSRASLHSVDRYLMQIRRLLSALERPIASPSNDGRMWHGYAPYNPAVIHKLLEIHRVFYNYVKLEDPRKDADGNKLPRRTPAMRLGLAKGPIRIEDILYHGPQRPRKNACG